MWRNVFVGIRLVIRSTLTQRTSRWLDCDLSGLCQWLILHVRRCPTPWPSAGLRASRWSWWPVITQSPPRRSPRASESSRRTMRQSRTSPSGLDLAWKKSTHGLSVCLSVVHCLLFYYYHLSASTGVRCAVCGRFRWRTEIRSRLLGSKFFRLQISVFSSAYSSSTNRGQTADYTNNDLVVPRARLWFDERAFSLRRLFCGTVCLLTLETLPRYTHSRIKKLRHF